MVLFTGKLVVPHKIAQTIRWIHFSAHLGVLSSGSDVFGSLCICPRSLEDGSYLLDMELNRVFVAHIVNLTCSPHLCGGCRFLTKQHSERGEPGCLMSYQPVCHDGQPKVFRQLAPKQLASRSIICFNVTMVRSARSFVSGWYGAILW